MSNERTIATLPALARPYLASELPDWVEPRWYSNPQEALAQGPGARIGWFDMYDKPALAAVIANAADMVWYNTVLAGLDGLPLRELHARGLRVTNGAGLNAITIAEYVLMGMLTIAKDYRSIVRAQDRHEWLPEPPGRVELAGSRALVLGYGGIGKLVAQQLGALQVEVTVVRRHGDPAGRTLGPDQWRSRLGGFDWVILAVPATPETERMIGAAELAAMKPGAVLLNVARGVVVDQDALVESLRSGHLGAAFLDVTDPEPLPPEHPLWSLDNAHVTMHLSGRAQTRMFERASQRFLGNLARYRTGEPLEYQVDLLQGY